MHWLYLHFPRLQLDLLELLTPEHKDPVVIGDATDNKVRQVSGTAAKCGIKVGMTFAEVTSINAQTRMVEYSAVTEAGHLEQLATTLYSIASDIVCYPTDGISINLSPLILYYQGLDNFIALCRRTLFNQRVHFSFGSGKTIEIAQVLARSKVNQVFAEPGQATTLLNQCALATTQLSTRDYEQLNRLGIRTLGQLLSLPLDEIGKRFNNQVIPYILALKGVKQPPYQLFHPRNLFSQYLELPFEVESAASLSRFIAMPLHNNCEYLRKRNLVTDTLSFEFRQRAHDPIVMTVQAGAAHHHPDEWQLLIDLKLEQLKLDSPVTSITLTCDQLIEFNPENLSLLECAYSRHAENMLLGRLLARLGSESVQTIRQINDHRLDYSRQTQSLPALESNLSSYPGQQPAWLYTNPPPLTDNTQIAYGPERIFTGWWDDKPVKRDYFMAVTTTGQRLWVFRDAQQQWFVHGYFA